MKPRDPNTVNIKMYEATHCHTKWNGKRYSHLQQHRVMTSGNQLFKPRAELVVSSTVNGFKVMVAGIDSRNTTKCQSNGIVYLAKEIEIGIYDIVESTEDYILCEKQVTEN